MYNHPPEGGVKYKTKMKTLKLEVGKTYRSRKGEEVKIVKHDVGSPWPYCGSSGKGYAADGKWASMGSPCDLIEEVPSETRHTFAIPEGVKEITLDYFGNRIVVEMVPEEVEPKPGDVMVNDIGSVYIFKAVAGKKTHRYYAWLGRDGRVVFNESAISGRPATPKEAQPLWDALKKAGKRWNPETMQVEDVPESDRIREWVWANLKSSLYDKGSIAEAVEAYLKHKEDEK